MYVVMLVGRDVFHDVEPVCVIDDLSSLNKARSFIKEHYKVEFETTSHRGFDYFDNITDDRDIHLTATFAYKF